jgi:hypothetical protein
MGHKDAQLKIRIPAETRRLLDQAVEARRRERVPKQPLPSRSSVVTEVLSRSLGPDAQGTRAIPLAGDALLAYRALAVAPAPIAIKSRQREILWGNLEYQRIAGVRSQRDLRNKKIEDFDALPVWEKEVIVADMSMVFERRQSVSFFEFVWTTAPHSTDGRHAKIPFLVHRFILTVDGVDYLGDVSFDCTQMTEGRNATNPSLSNRFLRDEILPGTDKLFLACFLKCPTAIAVKDAAGRLALYNYAYGALASVALAGIEQKDPEFLTRLRGLTAEEIWTLGPANSVTSNDRDVVRGDVWMYAHEVIDEKIGPRVSLRYPIPGRDGRPELIGVISTSAGRQQYQSTYVLPSPVGEEHKEPEGKIHASGSKKSGRRRGPVR